ncbi:MAG: HI1506-related protein [Geobacteraceae bacterium]|nr:HI1506-related protein [Geobacteraceae bacterium]
MIRIASKQDGFRRCGIAHPAEALEYADDQFTAAELKTLQAEPMLLVEVIADKKATK